MAEPVGAGPAVPDRRADRPARFLPRIVEHLRRVSAPGHGRRQPRAGVGGRAWPGRGSCSRSRGSGCG
ncbi:MAG: hypothetical protein MZV63_16820 [Marinilabiliales bacterium]|nr:hypothetical protein [Marinilabiliales bacterium]